MVRRIALASALAVLVGKAALAAPLPKPPGFAVCGACHKVEKGAPNGIGPNLFGVAKAGPGRVADFRYSPAMKAAKIRWTREVLIAFIREPQKSVPGNRMPFAGVKNPETAAQIADYLLSLN